MTGLPRCVLMVSGKGGVGKSTVAVALAAVLRRRFGRACGIVDCDLSSPSVATILGAARPPAVVGGMMAPHRQGGMSYLSMGLFGDTDEPFVWTGPLLRGVLSQFFTETDWSAVTMLLVDLPPGVSETHLAVLELCRPVGAVLVSTPHELAQASTERQLSFLAARDVPVLCVVENMAVVDCPRCGETFRLERQDRGSYGDSRPLTVSLPLSADLSPDGLRRLVDGAETPPQLDTLFAVADQVAAAVGGGGDADA